jgi:hypothetical protein
MWEFIFVLLFLIFFGVGFMVIHKKLEEILAVLVEIKDK